MNYDQAFADIKKWIEQNNMMASKVKFGSDQYWNWVVTSSAKLCDYYHNNPIINNIMLGLWNYLLEIPQ